MYLSARELHSIKLDYQANFEIFQLAGHDGGLTDDNNANGVGRVVEVGRGEVVDDGPGRQDGDDADRGAGHPAALVVVPLDPEDRHPVEEGEDEEEAGVDVEQEECLPGHITLRIEAAEGDGERHVDDVPLGG